jgi:hypothetical protein
VDSGDWATADSVINARERLQALCPYAVDVLFEWVGYRTLIQFRRRVPAEIRVIEGVVNSIYEPNLED